MQGDTKKMLFDPLFIRLRWKALRQKKERKGERKLWKLLRRESLVVLNFNDNTLLLLQWEIFIVSGVCRPFSEPASKQQLCHILAYTKPGKIRLLANCESLAGWQMNYSKLSLFLIACHSECYPSACGLVRKMKFRIIYINCGTGKKQNRIVSSERQQKGIQKLSFGMKMVARL